MVVFTTRRNLVRPYRETDLQLVQRLEIDPSRNRLIGITTDDDGFFIGIIAGDRIPELIFQAVKARTSRDSSYISKLYVVDRFRNQGNLSYEQCLLRWLQIESYLNGMTDMVYVTDDKNSYPISELERFGFKDSKIFNPSNLNTTYFIKPEE